MKKLIFIIILLLSFQISLNAKWEQVNNGLFGYEPTCIVINDNMILAGSYSGGVLFSTDNGYQWHLTAKPDSTKFQVRSMTVSGNFIYAGLGCILTHDCGIYYTTDNGVNWVNSGFDNKYAEVFSMETKNNTIFASTSNGLFRSNAGENKWTLLKDSYVYSLIIQDDIIYIAALDYIFSSSDQGENWTYLSKGIENYYFSSLAANDEYIFAGTWDGIFRSGDKGKSWEKTSFEYDIYMESLESNGSSIYALAHEGFFVSRDNGMTWNKIEHGLSYRKVIACAVHQGIVYATTLDGYLIFSQDDGVTWKGNNTGLNIGTVHTLGSFGNTLLATENYNGLYMSTDNGNNWSKKLSIPGAERIKSLAADQNRIFVGTDMVYDEKGSLFYSENHGESWMDINTLKDVRGIHGIALIENYIFARTDPRRILMSDNKGETWTKVLSDDFYDGNFLNDMVVCDNKIFIATYHGLIVSDENRTNWAYHKFDNENYSIQAIGVDKSNICVFASPKGFFTSTDSGISWEFKYGGFDNDYIHSIAVKDNNIFASNDSGIFVSKFDKDIWVKVVEGFPTVCPTLKVNDEYIFGVTEGQGLYRAKLSDFEFTDVINKELNDNKFSVYPNPAGDFIEIAVKELTLKSIDDNICKLQIFNLLGIEVMKEIFQPTANNYHLNISGLSPGVYYLKLGNESKLFLKE